MFSAALASQVALPFHQLRVQVVSPMPSSDAEHSDNADRSKAQQKNQAVGAQQNPGDEDAAATAVADPDVPPSQSSSGSSDAWAEATELLANLMAQPDSEINIQIGRLKAEREAVKRRRSASRSR